jgi:hypothetical protein
MRAGVMSLKVTADSNNVEVQPAPFLTLERIPLDSTLPRSCCICYAYVIAIVIITSNMLISFLDGTTQWRLRERRGNVSALYPHVEIWIDKHPTHSSCSWTGVPLSYYKLIISWNNRDNSIAVVMIPLCVGLDEQYLSKTAAAMVEVVARCAW